MLRHRLLEYSIGAILRLYMCSIGVIFGYIRVSILYRGSTGGMLGLVLELYKGYIGVKIE